MFICLHSACNSEEIQAKQMCFTNSFPRPLYSGSRTTVLGCCLPHDPDHNFSQPNALAYHRVIEEHCDSLKRTQQKKWRGTFYYNIARHFEIAKTNALISYSSTCSSSFKTSEMMALSKVSSTIVRVFWPLQKIVPHRPSQFLPSLVITFRLFL